MKIIDTSLKNNANALLNLIRMKNYLWALYIKYHKCKPVVKIKSLKNSMKYERLWFLEWVYVKAELLKEDTQTRATFQSAVKTCNFDTKKF